MLVVIVVLGFATAMLLIAVLWDPSRKYRAERSALARRRGWAFAPEHDRAFPRARIHFELFAHAGACSNTMIGAEETRFGPLDFRAGEYAYTTGFGQYSQSHQAAYLFAALPFHVPDDARLFIRDEVLADVLLDGLGSQDIDFESEEFSRRYFIRASDRKFAYAVIHPRMIEYLLEWPCGSVELRGNELLLFEPMLDPWTTVELENVVTWLQKFVDLWPDYLVNGFDAQEREAEPTTP